MSIRSEAVKRLVSAAGDVAGTVARKVDDWGWRGGKPGELTGELYDEIVSAIPNMKYLTSEKELVKYAGLSPEAARLAWDNMPSRIDFWDTDYYTRAFEDNLAMVARDQLRKSDSDTLKQLGEDAPWEAIEDFRILEEAGIPRRWTGKVEAAVPVRSWANYPFSGVGRHAIENEWHPVDHGVVADELSSVMRDLGDDKLRETFVQMLPRWPGSLADLGDFVSEMSSMPRLTREYLLQNAPKMFEMNMPREAIMKTALAMMQGK